MYSEEICTLKKFSVHRGHYCIMKEEGLCPEHYALVKHCCHFYYYTYIWVYACCTVFTFNHMQYIEHVHFTIAAGDTSAALLFTRNTHFTNLPCYFLLRSFVLLFMQTIPAGFKAQCHAWSINGHHCAASKRTVSRRESKQSSWAEGRNWVTSPWVLFCILPSHLLFNILESNNK